MENKIKIKNIKKEPKLSKDTKVNKTVSEKKEQIKTIKKKSQSQKIRIKNDKETKTTSSTILTKLNNKKLFFIAVIIIDIIITIYFARKNIANYIKIDGSEAKFVGETKNIVFGRNYITLITTSFFFIYTCLSNKILFHEKITKKFVITTFFFYLILNIILFIIFTKRVY